MLALCQSETIHYKQRANAQNVSFDSSFCFWFLLFSFLYKDINRKVSKNYYFKETHLRRPCSQVLLFIRLRCQHSPRPSPPLEHSQGCWGWGTSGRSDTPLTGRVVTLFHPDLESPLTKNLKQSNVNFQMVMRHLIQTLDAFVSLTPL